jgi:bacterioferritin (cytochrome b1)
MGTWNYEIVHDYNGSQLIKEFRAENKMIKDSTGTEDEALDFILYAEKCDGSISLGAVLLIKMSDAMVKYYYNYRGEVNLAHFWAKHISKQQKYNHTFHFTESQIAKAFIDSLALQTKLIGDVSVVYIANYAKHLRENTSSLLLENLKFTREQYDPTLNSENYLLYKSKKAADYFVSKCNDTTHALQQFKDKLSLFKSFKIAGLELNTPIISDIIFVIDNLYNKVASFRQWILKNQEAIQLKIAYLCGIWNGMVEFVSAIVDVVLLAVNVLVDELLEYSINLELLEIREGIEEVLVKLNKPPDKLVEQLLQAIERYKYTRYDDKTLTIYQKEYHKGEDEILAIDIITSIILIIRSVPSLAKNLSKFSKWVDEVLARNGKGALKVEEALQEAQRSKKIIGAIEYEMLNLNLLKKYIDDVLKISKDKGIKLEIKWIDDTHPEFLNMELLGKFEVTLEKTKVYLHLRPECPKITWFHEKKHLDDFLEIGWKNYTNISKKTPWLHEQSVWNYIYKNRNKWSEPELVDAYLYVRNYTRNKSLNKIKFELKEMEDLVIKFGLTD